MHDHGTETAREWCRYDWIQEYPWSTFEQAEACLYSELDADLSGMDDPVTWEIEQRYHPEEGGGFWFKCSDGAEGRAMVLIGGHLNE